MKKTSIFALICIIVLLGFSCTVCAFAQDDQDDGARVLRLDKIGPIKIGITAADVVKVMGEPATKTKLMQNVPESILTSRWLYPARGIEIEMAIPGDFIDGVGLKAVKSGRFKVHSVTAKKPCTYGTVRSVFIGSTYKEVVKAYKDYLRGPADGYHGGKTEDHVYIGTYQDSCAWGIQFFFKDGKVDRIFLGSYGD